MNAEGRPTKYKDEYAELAYKFCLLGATDGDLAAMFDVAESTIYKWKQSQPEFSESITRGKAVADAEIAHSLFHKAKGYSHDAIHFTSHEGLVTETPYIKQYPPDTQAASLWLRNRHPSKWRDKHEIEHTGDIIPVLVNSPDWLKDDPEST